MDISTRGGAYAQTFLGCFSGIDFYRGDGLELLGFIRKRGFTGFTK